jgi:hypothetical protein
MGTQRNLVIFFTTCFTFISILAHSQNDPANQQGHLPFYKKLSLTPYSGITLFPRGGFTSQDKYTLRSHSTTAWSIGGNLKISGEKINYFVLGEFSLLPSAFISDFPENYSDSIYSEDGFKRYFVDLTLFQVQLGLGIEKKYYSRKTMNCFLSIAALSSIGNGSTGFRFYEAPPPYQLGSTLDTILQISFYQHIIAPGIRLNNCITWGNGVMEFGINTTLNYYIKPQITGTFIIMEHLRDESRGTYKSSKINISILCTIGIHPFRHPKKTKPNNHGLINH